MKISSAGPVKGSTTGATPDFTIFTSAMEIDPTQENVVRMIGSSTERDLHGDTMAISALTDMAQVEPGLVIWLNHDYELPGSLFGSLLEKPELRLKDGIADLHIVSSVEMSNPNAVLTYGYIKKGTRLGCSIGCMILEAEIDEENYDADDWWWPPLIITHVLPLEWSVVGIPANQRSWVENAIKGLFDRSLSSGKVDEALRIAPAMKSLWPKDFPERLKGIEDASLRKELEAIPARPKPKQRIEWDPKQKVFMMNQKGVTLPLDRKDIPAFMAKAGEAPRYLGFAKETTRGGAVKASNIPGLDIEKLLSGMEEAPAFDEPDDPILVASEIVPSRKETDVDLTTDIETKEIALAAEKAEELTLPLTDDQGKAVSVLTAIKAAMDTPPPFAISANAPALPADVQLFNVLAERLGQSPISLDAQGQIHATKAFPELSPESVQEAIAKTIGFVETTKAGNEFSKENQAALQAVHDGLVQMCKSQFHPCKEMKADEDDSMDGDDNPNDGNDDNGKEKQFSAELLTVNSEIPALREDFKALIDTLKSQGHLVDPKAVKDLQSRIDAADRRLKDIQATTNQAEERLAKLQNAPLGQPTLLKRGIQDSGDTVTHQDFKALSASGMGDNERRWSLDEALKATTVVPRTLSDGGIMNYRKWPEGVGGSVQNGVRPALTSIQRQWMHPGDALAYNDGGEAAVPCYDDPAGIQA